MEFVKPGRKIVINEQKLWWGDGFFATLSLVEAAGNRKSARQTKYCLKQQHANQIIFTFEATIILNQAL